jgi:hypothetical protein
MFSNGCKNPVMPSVDFKQICLLKNSRKKIENDENKSHFDDSIPVKSALKKCLIEKRVFFKKFNRFVTFSFETGFLKIDFIILNQPNAFY